MAVDRKSSIILVTGATGRQGGAVCNRLLKEGWSVRAITRDPEKPPAKELVDKRAEVVKCDLEDASCLGDVLTGVYGVFAVLTPFEKGVEGEIRQGRDLVDAAKAAGVKHFVYSSVAAADKDTGIPHFESKGVIEKHLKGSGIPYTVLRPVFFTYNFMQDEIRAGLMKGVLSLPIRPDKPIQMLAVEDFAHFVAHALAYPDKYVGKELDIAGDEMTMTQAADVFSKITGLPVRYEPVPIERVRERSEDLAKMFRWLDEVGYHVDIGELRSMHPDMLTLASWLAMTGWGGIAARKAAA